jgi:hypothetical protein
MSEQQTSHVTIIFTSERKTTELNITFTPI